METPDYDHNCRIVVDAILCLIFKMADNNRIDKSVTVRTDLRRCADERPVSWTAAVLPRLRRDASDDCLAVRTCVLSALRHSRSLQHITT